MNLNETMFIISFLVILFITGLKLYNIMKVGQFYEMELSFIGFGALVIAWLLSLISLLTASNLTSFYSAIFSLNSIMLFISIFLLFGEISFNIVDKVRARG
jgi:hypothetical protein